MYVPGSLGFIKKTMSDLAQETVSQGVFSSWRNEDARMRERVKRCRRLGVFEICP